MNALKLKTVVDLPIRIGLIFTMLINGAALLTGEHDMHLEYLNQYNRTPVLDYPPYFTTLLYGSSILQLMASGFLIISLVKMVFFPGKDLRFFVWGVFFAILSLTLYGFMVRLLSNHGASATLYFYIALLYLYIGSFKMPEDNPSLLIFSKVKLLPIYFTLFYTMGFPGWQKVFNSSTVMDRYVSLFKDSFLANIWGGIEPIIYFLGVFELSVPLLLVVSLIKREFMLKNPATPFLEWALYISISTFIMLCFGLSVVLNYSGSTNLMFYAILTFGLYVYIHTEKKA